MLINDIPITVDLRAYYTIYALDEENEQYNVKNDIISEYQSANSVGALEGRQNTQSKLKK